MNKFLALVVWAVGYLGARQAAFFFMPGDTPLDSWERWRDLVLLVVLVFVPIWSCVLLAGGRLWKMK